MEAAHHEDAQVCGSELEDEESITSVRGSSSGVGRGYVPVLMFPPGRNLYRSSSPASQVLVTAEHAYHRQYMCSVRRRSTLTIGLAASTIVRTNKKTINNGSERRIHKRTIFQHSLIVLLLDL